MGPGSHFGREHLPWRSYGSYGAAGDGVSFEVHYSDIRAAGVQAQLTLTRT